MRVMPLKEIKHITNHHQHSGHRDNRKAQCRHLAELLIKRLSAGICGQ